MPRRRSLIKQGTVMPRGCWCGRVLGACGGRDISNAQYYLNDLHPGLGVCAVDCGTALGWMRRSLSPAASSLAREGCWVGEAGTERRPMCDSVVSICLFKIRTTLCFFRMRSEIIKLLINYSETVITIKCQE